MALRPRRTCASIHSRCPSQAERAYAAATGGGIGTPAALTTGGQGGGFSAPLGGSDPVAGVEEFDSTVIAAANWRRILRIVFRSTPVLRLISRCCKPLPSSVFTVFSR